MSLFESVIRSNRASLSTQHERPLLFTDVAKQAVSFHNAIRLQSDHKVCFLSSSQQSSDVVQVPGTTERRGDIINLYLMSRPCNPVQMALRSLRRLLSVLSPAFRFLLTHTATSPLPSINALPNPVEATEAARPKCWPMDSRARDVVGSMGLPKP